MFSVVLQSWPLILLSFSKLCSKNVEHKIKFDGLIWLFHSNSFIIRIASQILTDFSKENQQRIAKEEEISTMHYGPYQKILAPSNFLVLN